MAITDPKAHMNSLVQSDNPIRPEEQEIGKNFVKPSNNEKAYAQKSFNKQANTFNQTLKQSFPNKSERKLAREMFFGDSNGKYDLDDAHSTQKMLDDKEKMHRISKTLDSNPNNIKNSVSQEFKQQKLNNLSDKTKLHDKINPERAERREAMKEFGLDLSAEPNTRQQQLTNFGKIKKDILEYTDEEDFTPETIWEEIEPEDAWNEFQGSVKIPSNAESASEYCGEIANQIVQLVGKKYGLKTSGDNEGNPLYYQIYNKIKDDIS